MRKFTYILLLLLTVLGCKKTSTTEGPYLTGIYGPVSITSPLTISNKNPSFSTGDKVSFAAKFANDAVWTLKLTGTKDSATKTFTGIGNYINISNSLWNGSADNSPSFQNDTVIVKLSFSNDVQITQTDTLVIKTIANLNPKEVIVTNFLVSKRYCCGYPIPNGWPSDYPPITNSDNTDVKPDGNNYLLMTGTPWQTGSPYVNYLTINANCADVNYGLYFPLYADPTQVYFNIMVHGTSDPNVWLQVAILQNGGSIITVNIMPTWTGWKLLSFNYATIATAMSTPVAATPTQVTGVQFVLLSNSKTLPGPAVTVAFDHPTFTNGAPYQP